MANRSILQLVLLFFFAYVSSEIYDSLRFYQRRTNKSSVHLLKKMIGELHPECQKDRMDFQIPKEILQPKQYQKENATMVIHEMLQQIFLLFSSKNDSFGVNKTIIETFLNIIFQQMEHLEMALKKEMNQINSTRLNEENIEHLNNYYQRIMNYLENKKYSSCSWKIVQVETRLNFFFLYKLTERLKN
ncbi:interferon beta [Sminthopsis crassicaudata]|uniref:interferon beta n=1 Tax=Sminthopsis crassicaudata TaxID=9301 RepID=UPI003D689CEF